ncbi:helix-turn-helix domain-containing protein [Seohaeicola nanhaiensis]|uniref:Helix-turn-helix domain-containing protein n=1 Tax=Seohaeicola nanhaiensis TaxID=1387282 RepID=A0ABV9KG44_9RHOB
MDTNEPLIQIGLRAREMRRRRNLTLDELASAASLSKGHLSRFERGEKSLSMAALLRLTEALQMSVATLVGEDHDKEDVHIVRRSERKLLAADAANEGVILQSLNSSTLGRPPYEAFVLTCPEGVAHKSEAFHSGCEAMFVLRGVVTVNLDGRKVVLEAGDFLEFPGHMRHLVSAGAGGAELLLTVVGG